MKTSLMSWLENQSVIERRLLTRMDLFDASYLWASLLWGSIGSGFLLYGWRQKSSVPLVGGILLTVVSIFVGRALLMSLLCVLIIALIWWANRYLG